MANDAGDLTTRLYGIVSLAELQRRQGRLRQAATTYREALALVPEPIGLQTLLNGAAYSFGLGDLLREQNDLDAAEQHLVQGREMVLGTLATQGRSVLLGFVALARLMQVRGASSAAIATLQEFEALARERAYPHDLLARGAAARAHLALLQGDLPAAAQWAASSGLGPDDDLSYPGELEYLTLARVRIAQGRNEPACPSLDAVLRLLERLQAAAASGCRTDSIIEILILRALALRAQGDGERALNALEEALRLAAPEGYVRVFVDEGAPMASLLADVPPEPDRDDRRPQPARDVYAYARKLLAVLGAEGVQPLPDAPLLVPHLALAAPGGEPLTEREMDVLRLLACGRSNQAIADALVVAVGTVKRHVNSVMGKLQVASRLEAVARARELGLV